MIDDYLSNTINIILDSKLPKERKDKILASLRSFMYYFANRGINVYIDEKGFEQFKQKIQSEESNLECQNV